ncbi:hypothetical protein WOLCODRAFT_136451 [Wolfiporia cocos MD-104 SS10]|uniref:Uncharacterized protein n=1 Tax=Wolfiporia cocos (strain MD-104) TaxID=742152 RepID=A0A2H3JB28_WOLCO|nr:hypothetical protein WOLCODRAFT_136451 [Wolfiporia cocos MD-104 SS10]
MSTLTPSNKFDPSSERDWAANLGMLDWDTTNIVFTKRELLEFLKYVGVTVDPNFTNIQKLPRYARFGTFSVSDASASAELAEAPAATPAAQPASPAEPVQNAYRPSRRVRTAPGGAQTDIFGVNDDALANAPPRSTQAPAVVTEVKTEEPLSTNAGAESDVRPSNARRSASNTSSLWDAPAEPEFKPTRRVRERPGGKDSIASLF